MLFHLACVTWPQQLTDDFVLAKLSSFMEGSLVVFGVGGINVETSPESCKQGLQRPKASQPCHKVDHGVTRPWVNGVVGVPAIEVMVEMVRVVVVVGVIEIQVVGIVANEATDTVVAEVFLGD